MPKIAGFTIYWKMRCVEKEFLVKIGEQECIPVGCVPAARWPYAGVCFPGGVCSQGGVSAPGGCLLWGGLLRGCLLLGGCLLSGGLLTLWGSAPGGVWSRGVWSGGYIPACTEADTPSPLWTDTHLWKYYLGPTSLRLVMNCEVMTVLTANVLHHRVFMPWKSPPWSTSCQHCSTSC